MADEERIARVARALCVADGNDPDAEYTVLDFDEAQTIMREIAVTRWSRYVGEARRMVAAMVAVGVIE